MTGKTVRGTILLAVGVVLTLAARPSQAAAQDLYMPADLTEAPKIASMNQASRLIRDSYPDALRRRQVGGTVKLQFVIGPDGHVEPATIRVVASTEPDLDDAARAVAAELEFSPPKVNALAVRSQVILPLIYQP